MQEFVHHKIQTLSKYLLLYNEVQELHINNAFELDEKFSDLLNGCRTYFEASGTNNQVSEVLNILSMFEMARRGISPFKLEKINTGRRELKLITAFNGMEKLHILLKTEYEIQSAKLSESEELLSNLILSLIQSGYLNDNKISQLKSIEDIKAFWSELLAMNGSISIIDKKLRLKISFEDIYLLFEKIISKLN